MSTAASAGHLRGRMDLSQGLWVPQIIESVRGWSSLAISGASHAVQLTQ